MNGIRNPFYLLFNIPFGKPNSNGCQTLEIEELTYEWLSVRHLSVVMNIQNLSLPSIYIYY